MKLFGLKSIKFGVFFHKWRFNMSIYAVMALQFQNNYMCIYAVMALQFQNNL
jgi:hypothetical protein